MNFTFYFKILTKNVKAHFSEGQMGGFYPLNEGYEGCFTPPFFFFFLKKERMDVIGHCAQSNEERRRSLILPCPSPCRATYWPFRPFFQVRELQRRLLPHPAASVFPLSLAGLSLPCVRFPLFLINGGHL